jgi:dihydrofolate reductase
MKLVAVVAMGQNHCIGLDNRMPWHIPEDLAHFKALTMGKTVLMGRKTFESIGKPLPGRQNIVLTRDRDWRADGVTVVPNLAEAIAAAGLDPRARADGIMVIGGAQIYAEALPSATRIELTEVDAAPAGDTVMPPFDPGHWREGAREAHPAAEGQPGFAFVTLLRKDA